MSLFAWPKKAAFGRVVPKNKIYDHAAASGALKERFVQQVDQINWAFKLAPETVNLSATESVAEIQIFRITLKGVGLDNEVLKAIDRAIPFPLIFELMQGGRIKLAAAYKRPAQNTTNDKASDRWVVGSYFGTDWQPESAPRHPLPIALDMSGLYEQLLSPLVQNGVAAPVVKGTVLQAHDSAAASYTSATKSEQAVRLTLEQRIELAEAITAQQKEIEQIKARLGRERQFNKRVAINTELRDAKQELQRLTQQQAAVSRY